MGANLKKGVPRIAVLGFALFGIACGGSDEGGLLAMQECNPLGGNACITPWPSDLYAIEDSTTSSGMRLDVPPGALPTNLDEIAIDPTPFNRLDGFSSAAPVLISFEGGVDGSNLVPFSRYADSLTDESPTVIVDMGTGERVVHFAELDMREPDRFDSQALYLRPAVALNHSTRYAVAVRKSLKNREGGDLPISPGFAAILSGTTTTHERLEARRDAYSEVLASLASAGIPSDDLVVAWDFTTGSEQAIRRDMITSRDRTLEAAGLDGANIEVTVEKDSLDEDGAFRKIEGTFTAPLLLTNDGDFSPKVGVLRDSQGLPEVSGMHDVPFTAIVPECAFDPAEPVGIIVYGHGLLGKDNQVASGSQRALSTEMCAVVIGTIMRGMSSNDIPNVLLTLNDFNLADNLFDTLLQGINNHIALVQAIRGPMAQSLFLDSGGSTMIDTESIYYYGLSQGHIFGATVAAYDPHIKRAALGVGGANYSMMLERSLDWPTYRTVLIGAYRDPLSVSILIGLMQLRWDTTEPTNVISDLPGSAIPGTPEKQFLLHMSVADSEVPNISTEYQARTMGLPVLSPAIHEPYGVPAMPGPLSSGLVIFEGGFGAIPLTNEPPTENEAHYLTRNSRAAREQIKHFFETGEIIHTCGDGTPCDCTSGACD